jgi:hypothetical protein
MPQNWYNDYLATRLQAEIHNTTIFVKESSKHCSHKYKTNSCEKGTYCQNDCK